MFKFLTNLSLWKKITILTAIGLALGVGVFSTLGMRAVNEATEAMLQERLTTANLVADYVDEALVRAVNALENSARLIGTNSQTDNNFKPVLEALPAEYSRLSIQVREIYLIDAEGRIIYSQPGSSVRENLDVSFFGDINQSIEKNETTVSRMFPSPETGTPVIRCRGPGPAGPHRQRARSQPPPL